MITECLFQLDRVKVWFQFLSVDVDQRPGSVKCVVKIETDTGLMLTCNPQFIRISYLEMLSNYLEKHVEKFRIPYGPILDAEYAFLPYGTMFSLRTLTGTKEAFSFSIQVMVNLSNPDSSGVMAGIETSVSVANTELFIDQFRKILDFLNTLTPLEP